MTPKTVTTALNDDALASLAFAGANEIALGRPGLSIWGKKSTSEVSSQPKMPRQPMPSKPENCVESLPPMVPPHPLLSPRTMTTPTPPAPAAPPDWTDHVDLATGCFLCRGCAEPVTNPKRRHYCSDACNRAFWVVWGVDSKR